jgi:hypothetical protein
MFGKSETGGIFTRSIELIYKLPWQQRKRLRCIDWLSETLPRIFFPGVVFSLFYVFSVAISSRYPAPVFLLLPLCRPECHRWFRGPACSVLVAPWECLLMPALCLRFQLIWWFRGLASFFSLLFVRGRFGSWCWSLSYVCALSPVFVFLESAAADLVCTGTMFVSSS